MKPGYGAQKITVAVSRPARGAWIETIYGILTSGSLGSRPARGAWIETKKIPNITPDGRRSRPARGAWIETSYSSRAISFRIVAPRKGRVD